MAAGGKPYFRCPYCIPFKGGPGIKVPKKVGLYRIKEIGPTILLLECQKCFKTFRIRKHGSIIRWEDMADVEKIWAGERVGEDAAPAEDG